MFYFVYCLVNPQWQRRNTNWTNLTDCLYPVLLDDYLNYFLPLRRDTLPPMPHVASPVRSPVVHSTIARFVLYRVPMLLCKYPQSGGTPYRPCRMWPHLYAALWYTPLLRGLYCTGSPCYCVNIPNQEGYLAAHAACGIACTEPCGSFLCFEVRVLMASTYVPHYLSQKIKSYIWNFSHREILVKMTLGR